MKINIVGLITYLYGLYGTFQGLAVGASMPLDVAAIENAAGIELKQTFPIEGKTFTIDESLTLTRAT
jgi:hypothetical protein